MIRFGPVELPTPVCVTTKDDAMDVELKNLSTAQKNALAVFFKNDAKGMSETWVYTDVHGAERKMRFDESALVFVQFARDVWAVNARIVGEDVANDE